MITLNQNAPAAVAVKQGDSSHYYGYDNGQWHPLYGEGKVFGLREARKYQAEGKVAVPSTTTYLKLLAKDALTDWKIEQALLLAAREPWAGPNSGELLTEWANRIAGLADNSSRGAMTLGTDIHTNVELALAGKDWSAELDVYVRPVMEQLKKDGYLGGVSESCVGSLEHGYAGRCDLNHATTYSVIDFKSRKSNKNKTPAVPSYSTDELQLSSYGYALWGNNFFTKGRGVIYGISTSHPGQLTPHVFEGKDLVNAFEAFLGLTQVFRFEKSFDPRVKA